MQWYHTIDLPCGIATPGLTDHRTQLGHYGLPDDMRGMRALDVATFDGFWAFEMERRGAEVVCIDIPSVQCADIPDRIRDRLSPDQDHATGDGFRLAHELLGSRVERRELSVYDLDPEAVGKFDVVLMSDLLLHLRDPMRALERVYSVVRDGGHAIIAEPHNPELDVLGESAVQQLLGYERYVWGIPSATLLRRMLSVAGFGQVDEVSRFRLNYRGTFPLESRAAGLSVATATARDRGGGVRECAGGVSMKSSDTRRRYRIDCAVLTGGRIGLERDADQPGQDGPDVRHERHHDGRRRGPGAGGPNTDHEDEPYWVAVQPDGNLVVAGKAYNPKTNNIDFAVLRFRQDGSLDPAFGWYGIVLVDFVGARDEALSVAIQPDSKIVLQGLPGGTSTSDFGLARLNANGSRDTSSDGTAS